MDDKEEQDDDSCRIEVHIRLRCLEMEVGAVCLCNIFADGTKLQIPNSDGRLDLARWYRFDHIYPLNTSNKEVYRASGYDLVEDSLNGINTAMFAYGQTGSGKTQTLMSKGGVLSYMVSHLFHRIWKNDHEDVKVALSYYQIHNERVYDLLNSDRSKECFIREDPFRGIYVENLTWVLCETPMDVYESIDAGHKALQMSETKMNRLSCKSHTIIQLSIEKRKKSLKSNIRTSSALNDLQEGNQVKIDFTNIPFNRRDSERHHRTAAVKANELNRSPHSPHTSLKSHECHRDHTVTHGKTKAATGSSGFQRCEINSPRDIKLRDNSRIEARVEDRPPSNTMDCRKDCGKQRGTSIHKSECVVTTVLPKAMVSSQMQQPSFTDDIQKQDNKYIQFISNQEKSRVSEYVDLECFPVNADDAFDDHQQIILSKITIVDLAGSEGLRETYHSDTRRENGNINISLVELGNVISALANGKRKHVTYENSVLTRLLQESLGGNCKTKFVLFVSTKLVDANETKRTLEFGQKLMEVSTKPKFNVDIDYKRKCDELLSQLNMKEDGEKKTKTEHMHHLNEFAKEKEEARVKLREQELLITMLQTKLNSADMKQKQNSAEINNLQKILEYKDNILNTQDMEIMKQKMELYVMSEKLAVKKFLNDKKDASTNKSDQNSHGKDVVGDTLFFSLDQQSQEEEESTIYRKYMDVMNSHNPLRSNKLLGAFSGKGLTTETKDASTNTTKSMEAKRASTKHPIIVSFLIAPRKRSAVVTASRKLPRGHTMTSDASTNTRDVCSHVDCSTQTNFYVKHDVDRLTSAILVQLSSLRKLCQLSKLVCDEPLFQSDISDDLEDLEDTDFIKDGLTSVIEEIFDILLNMFSESNTNINKATPLGVMKHNKRIPNEQLLFLKEYLRRRKKFIDKKLLKTALNVTASCKDSKVKSEVLERDIIHRLTEKLSGEAISLLPLSSLKGLEKLFNTILSDHTITACLLALTLKLNSYYLNYSKTDFELMSNWDVEPEEVSNISDGSQESLASYHIRYHRKNNRKYSTGLSGLLCAPFN